MYKYFSIYKKAQKYKRINILYFTFFNMLSLILKNLYLTIRNNNYKYFIDISNNNQFSTKYWINSHFNFINNNNKIFYK